VHALKIGISVKFFSLATTTFAVMNTNEAKY